MDKAKIGDFAKNIYSQYGEDGIIEKVFAIMGTRTRLCVEFGAWDGLFLSNTRNLWTHGWKAVLIEGDEEKFRQLVENTTGYDCTALNAFIGIDHQRDSLEYVLKANQITENIDLLSIDVDGNDYYIFESLKNIRPRVVTCEYNPTIPYYMDIYAPFNNYFGCSAASLNRIAATKGYSLIAMTETNCVYVVEEEYEQFADYETDLDKVANRAGLNYIITGYAGDYMILGNAYYGMRNPVDIDLVVPEGIRIRKELRVEKEER